MLKLVIKEHLIFKKFCYKKNFSETNLDSSFRLYWCLCTQDKFQRRINMKNTYQEIEFGCVYNQLPR